MNSIQATQPVVAPVAASRQTQPSGPAPDLHKVAAEFETLMVHELLEAAKVGGTAQGGAYAGMTVDALANGISGAGGLGLARELEAALSRRR